jgi:hypothetical protein
MEATTTKVDWLGHEWNKAVQYINLMSRAPVIFEALMDLYNATVQGKDVSDALNVANKVIENVKKAQKGA